MMWDPEVEEVEEIEEFVPVPATTELLQFTTEANVEDNSATAASWKDDYAVNKLIHLWKINQPLFKNCKICNDVVWRQIAKKLQTSNPNWVYTGTQCENKFKDVRKKYVKVKDHNANSTGGERKTCKFYEEMNEIFGDKPYIKPVSIASTLRKRPMNNSPQFHQHLHHLFRIQLLKRMEYKKQHHLVKEKRIAKSKKEWAMLMRQDSLWKEIERERRHKEILEKQEKTITAYQELMTKLLNKL